MPLQEGREQLDATSLAPAFQGNCHVTAEQSLWLVHRPCLRADSNLVQPKSDCSLKSFTNTTQQSDLPLYLAHARYPVLEWPAGCPTSWASVMSAPACISWMAAVTKRSSRVANAKGEKGQPGGKKKKNRAGKRFKEPHKRPCGSWLS